ncbi:helix-turn-helix domain-containing protein [Rhodococcus sp. MS16]
MGIGTPRTEIAKALGIGRATLYRHCQVDGWRTALLNAECQKTTACSAKA